MEVYVHDEREQFTKLFNAEFDQVLLQDKITHIFIRPEVIQKRGKGKDSCIMEDSYSYSRVN